MRYPCCHWETIPKSLTFVHLLFFFLFEGTQFGACTMTNLPCHRPDQKASSVQSPTAFTSHPEEKHIRDLLLQEANYDIQNPSNTAKRQSYLQWDQYFMSLSLLSAQRSKDPNSGQRMGACIVDSKNRIVGIGYNGFPRGCSDDVLPWASSSDTSVLHTRDAYMCRAEVNAILNKCSENLEEARMYVLDLPCTYEFFLKTWLYGAFDSSLISFCSSRLFHFNFGKRLPIRPLSPPTKKPVPF